MTSLVITGCQRSGTMYTATVLTAAGFTCGHERYYRMKPPLKELPENIIESSWMAYPHLAGPEYVVLQVRHPLDVAASMMERGTLTPTRRVRQLPPSGRWIVAKFPELEEIEEEVLRCLRYWTLWNRMIRHRAEQTWRVEDLRAPDLIVALGHAGHSTTRAECDAIRRALEVVPKNVNTSPHGRLTWDDVPKGGIRRAARRLSTELGYPK